MFKEVFYYEPLPELKRAASSRWLSVTMIVIMTSPTESLSSTTAASNTISINCGYPTMEQRRELWVPIMMAGQVKSETALTNPQSGWLNLTGRLKPLVTRDETQADLTLLYQRLEQEKPEQERRGVTQFPLRFELCRSTLVRVCLGAGAGCGNGRVLRAGAPRDENRSGNCAP